MNKEEFLLHLRVKAIIWAAEEERAKRVLQAAENRWRSAARETNVYQTVAKIEACKQGVELLKPKP